jgi:hypothetical protein
MGFFRYLSNLRVLFLQRARSFVYWGHLGLGDQICSAKLLEHWSLAGRFVHVPCKSRDYKNLKVVFSYLDNVRFHPISDSPKKEKSEVRSLAKKLGLPVVSTGRRCLAYTLKRCPDDGLNIALMKGAGFHTLGLSSIEFRKNVLALNQIQPPRGDYAFVNELTSRGSRPIEGVKDLARRLDIVYETSGRLLYEHALLIDKAKELHSVGSAFMCLALVIDANPATKKHYLDYQLLSDDPYGTWTKVKE